MSNTLDHLTDLNLPGQLLVDNSNKQVTATDGSGNKIVVAKAAPSKADMDSEFLTGDLLPITRVGDLQYVPLDIKGDFRSSINPSYSIVYPLLENDGTLVMLRAGYNSKYQGIFYTYSTTGSIATSDIIITDYQYRPAFLATTEYVDSLLDGNQFGFLACIKDTSKANTFSRYLWIQHNGTLNAQFHTYIDVTTITNSSSTVSYIPELNMLITMAESTSQIIYKFYNNTRTFSAVAVNESGQPAYTVKAVDWVSLDGTSSGNNNTATVIDWPVASLSTKIKYLVNGVEQTLVTGSTVPIYYHTMRANISYSLMNGVLRLTSHMAMRLTSTTAQSHVAILAPCMEYTVATNQLRPFSYANNTQYQALPIVIDGTNGTIDTNPSPADPTSPLYKRNKAPVAWPNGSLRYTKPFLLEADRIILSDKPSGVGVYITARQFSLTSFGSTKAERWHAFLTRPWYQSGQTASTNIVSSDASVMAKDLQWVRFVNTFELLFVAASKLPGDTSSVDRVCLGTIPDSEMTEPVIMYDNDTAYVGLKPVQSPVVIPDSTQHPMLTIAMSYADGSNAFQNPRAVSPFLLDTDSDATWNAARLKYNVNFATGSVATNYSFEAGTKAKIQTIVDSVIAGSTVPSPNVSAWMMTPLGFMADGRMMLLVGLSFGVANSSYRAYHLHIAATVTGTVLSLPASPIPAMISNILVGSSDSGQYTTYLFRQGGGSYRHSDGRFFYIMSICGYSVPGGNSAPVMAVEIGTNGLVTRSRAVSAASSWQSSLCDVHSKFGPYWTDSYLDTRSKTIARYVEKASLQYDAAHQLYCWNSLLTNNSEVVAKFLATTRSAEGFYLYVSEFPVFMRGKAMLVPTQTINLATWNASPANKTFLVYVEENNYVLTVKGYTTAQPETYSRVYIGKVITGAAGVASSNFDKVTRLDIYRPDTGAVIGSGIRAYPKQPDMSAYMYATTAEANAARSSKVPPGFATVFNSWDRTEANNYYPGGAGATGDSAAWTLGTNPDRVIQPNNTTNYCSFISPTAYTDFEFEATLFSSNADDDLIGVVVGFTRESNVNYVLTLIVNAGGISHANNAAAATAWDFGFVLLSGGSIPAMPSKLVQPTRANANSGPGWGGAYRRVRVVRDGDVIRATCSAWSASQTAGLAQLPESELVLDLASLAQTNRFLGSSKYGYTTVSQAGATYYDISFMGAGSAGIDPNYIYDAQSGQVWKYVSGAWTLQSGVTIQSRFNYVRKVTNPDTSASFLVKETTVTPI